ncbi:hypothetical protein PSTT_02689 [Puccinia striiformis]|uniref:Peroxisomal membrane protein PEX14 n=1 Tax=Puccinia striiformis TaxID=27350 RepID=A0A2S4VZ81_9BASI|nr:hypothetical protein PSTT_02689 [Puccinia striiformis]
MLSLLDIGTYQADRDATDWRDWFVMTVIGGGVGYLLINLAKTIQADTEIVKKEMSQQTEKLGLAMKEVESAVEECLSGEIKRDQELHTVQREVEGLRTSVQQMIQSNKESQTAAIVDLQTELKSLKSLMAARPGIPSASNHPGSSTNGVSTRTQPNGTGLNTFGIQSQANSLSKFQCKPTSRNPCMAISLRIQYRPSSQTPNGDQTSNPTAGSTVTPPASGSSPMSKPLVYTNGNGNLDDLGRCESVTPEVGSSRHSLVDDDDDHIINSKYTTDKDKSGNEPVKASIDGLLS